MNKSGGPKEPKEPKEPEGPEEQKEKGEPHDGLLEIQNPRKVERIANILAKN